MCSSSTGTSGSTRPMGLRRSGRTAGGWTMACTGISSAERLGGRLSRTGSFSSAAISVRSFVNSRTPTSRMCRRPRCWPATLPPSPRRRATAGEQLTLRAPFVNNRDRSGALQSRRAGRSPSRCPSTTDPCGEIRFPFGGGENIQAQPVARVDFQRTANDSIFARYMATTIDQDIPDFDNILSAMNPATIGLDNLSQAVVFGNTRVFGSNTVNSLRVAYNRTRALRLNRPAIGPEDLGIRALLQLRAAPHGAEHHRRVHLRDQCGQQQIPVADIPGDQRPHARTWQPSDRARRDARLLEHLHQELHAVRRPVRVQRPGDRPGFGGFSAGQSALDGASRRRRHRSRNSTTSGSLRPTPGGSRIG